jgi:hypothetical protein
MGREVLRFYTEQTDALELCMIKYNEGLLGDAAALLLQPF